MTCGGRQEAAGARREGAGRCVRSTLDRKRVLAMLVLREQAELDYRLLWGDKDDEGAGVEDEDVRVAEQRPRDADLPREAAPGSGHEAGSNAGTEVGAESHREGDGGAAQGRGRHDAKQAETAEAQLFRMKMNDRSRCVRCAVAASPLDAFFSGRSAEGNPASVRRGISASTGAG